MRSEKEKMLAGKLYDPFDAELVQARERVRDLCQELNASREREQEKPTADERIARRLLEHRALQRSHRRTRNRKHS
jgi:hypothetical protein